LRRSTYRRAVAIAAVAAAVVVIAFVIFGSGASPYQVHAIFQNASQIVNGDYVQVAGLPAGKVTNLQLTPDGRADLTLQVDSTYAPLRVGTQAVIRATGLTGVANRYVSLNLAPATNPKIPNGGQLGPTDTTSAVDLDQLFNTFDSKTRRSLQRFIQGNANLYTGQTAAARLGWLYLDPFLSTSSQVLAELDRDTPAFERFVVANSRLATDVAQRENDLANLVDRLSTATGAIAAKRQSLADAIATLPPFMRQANSTFVDLRSTLGDLKPLVDQSKPVAKKLRPYLAELRPFIENAQPTIRDLSSIISAAGPANDLIELTQSNVPVRDIAVGPVQANGKQRPGALPASTEALNSSTPELGFARPYAVDLTGWFDDFGHTGLADANGGMSRAGFQGSAFSLQNGVLQPVPADLRAALFNAVAVTNYRNRCPGSDERSTPDSPLPFKPSPDYPCDASEVPIGP
jgi:phospholipid/cholesterol/gamma-HCH transport system substrate-binding protein